MLKKFISKGLLHGCIAALLITFFDSLFILKIKFYIPYTYPFLLIIFNIIFWGIFGSISGFILWIFAREKEQLTEKEGFYWTLFFLVPFSIVYGILGRIYSPLVHTITIRHPTVFDHHLSFVWVGCIILFLLFYLKRYTQSKNYASSFFILELSFIIMLFYFCSNIARINIINAFFKNHMMFFQKNMQMDKLHYLRYLYISGTVLILGTYCIVFYTTQSLRKQLSTKRVSIKVFLLFVIVIVCLKGFYSWNKLMYEKHNVSNLTTGQNNKTISGPNIILIVLDTLRADHMSPYGYAKNTTKNLEEFSQHCLVFDNCVSTTSWTLPAHASIFTGLYISEHGAHSNLKSEFRWIDGFPPPRSLSEHFVTLAEILSKKGYKTCAIISNHAALDKRYKVNQGFQVYDIRGNIGQIYFLTPFRPLVHLFCYLTNIAPKYIIASRTADDINREASRLINKFSQSPPFFLFLNYMDSHAPYRPPHPYDGYFLKNRSPQLYRLKLYLRYFLKRLDQKSMDTYLVSQYDGEIAYLDSELGKLFSHLRKLNIYDSSLIIITSDHGELFGEHGLYRHKVPLYEGVVKVPLLIKFPFDKRVGRDNTMISLADIYPTILSICGLPIPDGISGKAFGWDKWPLVTEFYNDDIGEHRALYKGKYKYMKYQYQKPPELYNLDTDPKEQNNLAEALPEIASIMDKELTAWKTAHPPKYGGAEAIEPGPSQDVIDGLKALGYIQ